MRVPSSSCLAILAALTAADCSRALHPAAVPGSEHRREPEPGQTDPRKKTWSGRSYAARTRVEARPSASLAASGFDSERVWSPLDDWEPAVAVDAAGSRVYQVASRGAELVTRRSADGGSSFDVDRVPFPGTRWQGDGRISVTASDSVLLVYMHGSDVLFTRSIDQGATWSPPLSIVAGPGRGDFPHLIHSADGRDIYIAFQADGGSYVAASHDFGATFAAPVRTDVGESALWFHAGGLVAPGGTAYFSTIDYQPGLEDLRVAILRSTDGGVTWMLQVIDTAPDEPGTNRGWLWTCPTLARDSAGAFLLAYNVNTQLGGVQSLFVRTSADGVNWSARRKLSVDIDHVHNDFPVLAAGPAPGDFRLVWQDARYIDESTDDEAWNTWYRQTLDGGATWGPALRLSDLGSGAPYKGDLGYRFPYGDYLELDVDASGRNHVIWGEGDDFGGPGGVWYTRGDCRTTGTLVPVGNDLQVMKGLSWEDSVWLRWNEVTGAAGYNLYRAAAPDFRSAQVIASASPTFAFDYARGDRVFYRVRSVDCLGIEAP